MISNKPFHPPRQRGASLIITLMIVVLLSLLALYGAGILVLDTRSAANDFRAREAMAAAESGTEQGLSLLNANKQFIKDIIGLDLNNDGDAADTNESTWTTCTSTASPCLSIRSADRTNWQYITMNAMGNPRLTSQPGAGSFILSLLTPSSGSSSRLVYNIVAIGLSADGTSSSAVKQGAYFYPLLLGNVSSPLAAASNLTLSGNYSIITNSNGGGAGVPVSAWSNSTLTPSGSFSSCHIGDFVGGVCPSSTALSKNGLTGPDMVGNDPNFPTDLFQFLFGVPASQYQTIKDQATVVADCSGLTAASSGLIWVTGNCEPTGTIGSAANPVILVVAGNNTHMNASDRLYGLLYIFPVPLGGIPDLTLNGGAHLNGAVFTHAGVNLQLNGNFVLEFDQGVLDKLRSSPSGRSLVRIPGAWSDVL